MFRIIFLSRISLSGLTCSVLAFACTVHASPKNPGLSSTEIVLGTSTNLKAKTVGVAIEFNNGLSAYIAKINRSGGIFGRKIRRIIYDDGYEPDRTYAQTKKLIERDHVFALIGYASTPGVKKILPLIEQAKIPVIAPYSGAAFLRDAREKYIFNIKAGYSDQMEALTKLAAYSLGVKDICAFYQNDELGFEGKNTADRTLKKYNDNLRAQADYQRNSMDVAPAVRKLKAAGCKAVLMASQDRQAAAFIKSASAAGFHPLYFCLNLIGTTQFLTSVEPLHEKIYVAAILPLPSETAYPIVREFRKEISSLNPKAKLTINTFEGYLAGAVLEVILRHAGKTPTRLSVSAAFENLSDENIGGLRMTFNQANRQATNRVLITKTEGAELELLP